MKLNQSKMNLTALGLIAVASAVFASATHGNLLRAEPVPMAVPAAKGPRTAVHAEPDSRRVDREAIDSQRYEPAPYCKRLYATGVDDAGQRLPDGQRDPHWSMVKYDLPRKGERIWGHLYLGPSPVFAVRGFFGNPAVSTASSDASSLGDPANGYYAYETRFPGVSRDGATTHLAGHITVDDGVISVSLNGSNLPLLFEGHTTQRSVDGVTKGDFCERAIFNTDVHLVSGPNTLRIVGVNQAGWSNPHSIQLELLKAPGPYP